MNEDNIFGKQRGRFNEKAAQQAVLDQPDLALAMICSMNDERFAAFVALFNRVHDVPGAKRQARIVCTRIEP